MTSVLWVLCAVVVFKMNFVLSAPPAYVVSTRPTVRLSDQEFEHIIKDEQRDEQENTPKKQQQSPDEISLVRTYLKYYYFLKLLLHFILEIKMNNQFLLFIFLVIIYSYKYNII
jgi:hypothetical protein